MDNGYPVIPLKYQYVKFNVDWQVVQNSYVGSTSTGYGSSSYSVIPKGTIGQVLDTKIEEGYSHDLAGGYILSIGIMLEGFLSIVKLRYMDRPDAITVIPDTPAGRVLYGKNGS